MSACILLLMHLLVFQEVDFCASTGKLYPSCGDNPYESKFTLGICGEYRFNDNLEGSLHYSHIWLRPKTKSGQEPKGPDNIYGTLRVIKRVSNFADAYAFGGGGVWVNTQKDAKFSACYGLGAKKKCRLQSLWS